MDNNNNTGYKGTQNLGQNQLNSPNFRNELALLLAATNGQQQAQPTPKEVDLTQEPTNLPFTLFAGDTPLIAKGELCTIVAQPGSGKSNISEGITAAYLRSKGIVPLDTLGFVYPGECATEGKKVLWIDTERIENDILKTAKRLRTRCNTTGAELSKHLQIFQFSEIDNTEEATKAAVNLIDSGSYDLVIVDGILDFCPDMNHIEKSIAAVKIFRAAAVRNNVPIVVTIHPNKGTEVMAGHLGSMLYRWSRATLFIKTEPTYRILTSEFAQRKLSYSSDIVNIYFSWDTELNMFLSCDAPEHTNRTKYELNTVLQIFEGKRFMLASEFKEAYKAKTGMKDSAVRTHCKALLTDGIIQTEGNTTNTKYTLIYTDNIPF